jgi:hypothetical protein
MDIRDVEIKTTQLIKHKIASRVTLPRNAVLRNAEVVISYDIAVDALIAQLQSFVWREPEVKKVTETKTISYPKGLWDYIKLALKKYRIFSFLSVTMIKEDLHLNVEVSRLYPDFNPALPKEESVIHLNYWRGEDTSETTI